ncbi:hypothetical protein FQA39_LY14152 [Lamprigera yunnana]|nr:hypothetical protein FQA39_LY14152 [Lamprigera yunnana]
MPISALASDIMEHPWIKCCVVFVVLNFLFGVSTTEQTTEDRHKLMGVQWYINKNPNLQLTSHVLRKKRNSRFDDIYRVSSPLGKEQTEAIVEALQEPPWTILTFNEGKRHTVNFTPRLGRESGEDETANYFRDDELSKELMTQRSPPFAPRLGKRANTYYFDPRLGKRDEMQKNL